MDYLLPWDEDQTDFTLMRGTCGCCGKVYSTDATREVPITVEMLDKWEKWLWEQLANVYKCRHIVVSPMLMTTYRPSLDLAWEVAVLRAKRLGQSWRGRNLPQTGVDNPVDAELTRILDEFEDSLDGDERDEQIIKWSSENYSDLWEFFFEQYNMEDD